MRRGRRVRPRHGQAHRARQQLDYNYLGLALAASLGVPANKLNIVPTLAGGSFGSKLFLHKVPVIAATLARATGRPVQYLEDRIDNITAATITAPTGSTTRSSR